MANIELRGVSKTYGRGRQAQEAVCELSYLIEDGHFVSLLGPSGCGKSTTLNMIAGLEDITDGEILIDGRRVDDVDPDKRDLAFVFQDYALYPHMNVYDNIGFGLKMHKVAREEIRRRVHDATKRLEIDQYLNARPRALSGGQRQRVALARAIARRPAVFLFDEPLSNLDALLRDQTRSELKLLHQDLGATSVYVTHDQEEAMTLSDKIAVMSRGRLEQYATPFDVYHRPATRFVATFVGKPRMNIFDATKHRTGIYRIDGTTIDVPIEHVGADKIHIGLRPEECSLTMAAPGDDPHGVVRTVEPLGTASDVTVEAGTRHFRVRLPGFSTVAPDTPVRVTVEHATTHCFDIDSGARLT